MGNDQQIPKPIAVQLAWTKQDGIYNKSGFAFEVDVAVATELANLREHSAHRIWRCVLYPQNGQ